ncbi:hypothetical protein [Heliorestis convoluta]|uniref:Uncharacterized protein n=1 Tax=Heliorestis convoluta TaxID=356322 RepID=A0A5Q2N409_9FIRM|nr:hypothetical protein [Heliorestis convoluta]QGG48042.1 hypothetical protein FTV88_1944 [Heliorestis convoluta]
MVEETTKRVTLYVTEEFREAYARAEDVANQKKTSISSEILNALKEYFDQRRDLKFHYY